MTNKHHPYHPVVYVRGFAVSQSEIEETVADPYMGFNLGSTKTRQVWDGRMRKFFFESPLVRLRDEVVWLNAADGIQRSARRYDDVYVDGEDLTAPDPQDPTKPLRPDIALPYQSIVIFRYYDEASESFGTGESPHRALRAGTERPDPEIEDARLPAGARSHHAATRSTTGSPRRISASTWSRIPWAASSAARSSRIPSSEATTLAAPSTSSIRTRPRTTASTADRPQRAGMGDVRRREQLQPAEDGGLPRASPRSRGLRGRPRRLRRHEFPPRPYLQSRRQQPRRLPRRARHLGLGGSGEDSDGLVRIENATTHGGDAQGRTRLPRAFAHRSHSGHYGS